MYLVGFVCIVGWGDEGLMFFKSDKLSSGDTLLMFKIVKTNKKGELV